MFKGKEKSREYARKYYKSEHWRNYYKNYHRNLPKEKKERILAKQKEKRNKILNEHNDKCELCNSTKTLHIHHPEPTNKNNVQVLCENCHLKTHNPDVKFGTHSLHLNRNMLRLMVFMIGNDIKRIDQNIYKTKHFYDIMRFLVRSRLINTKRIKIFSNKIYYVNYYGLTFDGWVIARRVKGLV